MERKKYWSLMDGDNGVLHCQNHESIEAMFEQYAREYMGKEYTDYSVADFIALPTDKKIELIAENCMEIVNHDNPYPDAFCMWDFVDDSPIAEYEGVEIREGRAEYYRM